MEKETKRVKLVEDILGGGFLDHHIQEALEDGADANASGSDGMTPLMAVSRNCGRPEIRLLLERGADPRPADMFGRTALHHAVISPCEDNGIQLLIEAGADVHAVDRNGNTPLHTAAVNSEWTGKVGAECLLRHDADPFARTNKGKTPFDLAGDSETKVLLKAAMENRSLASDLEIKLGTPGDKFWRGPRA
jgi:ankyrin repeat protein